MDNALPSKSPFPNSTSLHHSPFLQPHFRSATNLFHTSTDTKHAYALHTTTYSSNDQPRSETMECMESNVNNNIIGQPQKVRPVRKDKSDSNLNCNTQNRWGDNPTLKRLELFYPLARTHIGFEIHELAVILRRIENGFRTLSLDVLYNQFPISAICISLDQVKISVQFWQARENSSRGILEIMRIAGDTIISHHYIRQLLKHASGRCDDDAIDMNDSSLAYCVTRRSMEGNRLQNTKIIDALVRQAYVQDTRSSRDVLCEVMDVASTMLRSDRSDARQLGLESLIALTDPGKTGTAIATAAARCILAGTTSYNNRDPFKYDEDDDVEVDYTNMRDSVLGLALTGRWPEDEVVLRNDEDEEMINSGGGSSCRILYREAEGEVKSKLFSFAWAILTQALNLASTTEVSIFLRYADRHCGAPFGFVHYLSSGIHAANSNDNYGQSSIHMVFFHIACLEVICKHMPAIKSMVSLNQVQYVQKYGMLHHAALSQAASHLRRILITTAN